MGMTDKIEAFIMELMKDEADYAEFGRNEIADIFGCVPSQINYVISTRFCPEKGYAVESRRGGGGYIKIRRINLDYAQNALEEIGESCSESKANTVVKRLCERGDIERGTAAVLISAVSDKSLKAAGAAKDAVRADIIKNTLCEL